LNLFEMATDSQKQRRQILYRVTISLGKIILQREKEHCAIFICPYFMSGLQLGLGLGVGNRLNF